MSPHLVRLVLAGDGLRDFPIGAFTDHYVKLLFPPAGASYRMPFDSEQVRAELPKEQWPSTRTFTVRAFDNENNELTIDCVVHGDSGLAGPWAARAQPGDEIQLLGPGGGYAPSMDADWHLLVGDASALPAIALTLARIPAGSPAHAYLYVDDQAEEQQLPTAAEAHIHWLHRTEGSADVLLDAVRALEFPPGTVDAFVHGEAGVVRAVRRHLLVERGVPREALSASGYWKDGRTDEGWRADKPEWKREAALDEQ
jgi:NADPH-dependent ferric siderophore reductase